MATSRSLSPVATLLFCHGAGYTKETWAPIVRRLQNSLLLQRVPCEIVCFDFAFHGENSKEEPKPRVHFVRDGAAKRVDHPGNVWDQWAPQEVYEKAQLLMTDRKRPVIGIGHSMGGASLWGTEARHPGTFEALVLFEPMYADGDAKRQTIWDLGVDFLVDLTLQRVGKWSSREEAETYFAELKSFANWDREALEGYLKGALMDQDDGSVALACPPDVEAAMYCASALRLSAEELAQPRCPITFHSGARTRLFLPEVFADLQQRFPKIYSVEKPIPKATHGLVVEDPESCANGILKDLARLPLFQTSLL